MDLDYVEDPRASELGRSLGRRGKSFIYPHQNGRLKYLAKRYVSAALNGKPFRDYIEIQVGTRSYRLSILNVSATAKLDRPSSFKIRGGMVYEGQLHLFSLAFEEGRIVGRIRYHGFTDPDSPSSYRSR